MIIRRPLLIGIAACAVVGTLLLGGCGDDDPQGASVASTVAPEPLPIEERVVAGADLGGLAIGREPRLTSTPEEFARLVDAEQTDGEAASLRSAGFVQGAVKSGDLRDGFGVSAVIQYDSPEGARAELARLGGELARDLPPGATQGALADVPGSRTIVATAMDRGQAFTFAAAVFADGPFLYAQIASGSGTTVRPEDVLAAASVLRERVTGRPAP